MKANKMKMKLIRGGSMSLVLPRHLASFVLLALVFSHPYNYKKADHVENTRC